MGEYVVEMRRFTRAEYDRLIEVGFFQPSDPIELVGGQLLVAERKTPPHYVATHKATHTLEAAFGPGWWVRSQAPISLDDESEPDPDVAVVPGSVDDYLRDHPARPILTVEVAESSLAMDRQHKGGLYARAGLADYWVVNLIDRVVEVYREPVPDAEAPFGWRYASCERLGPTQMVTPVAVPGARIRVADLLP